MAAVRTSSIHRPLIASVVLLAICERGDAAARLFFDVSAGDRTLGRIVVRLDEATAIALPRMSENVRQLAAAERAPVDARLTYRGCAFEYSPSYVEGPQYKWAHVLKGNGLPALPPTPEERAALLACTRDCFGGSYYGMRVEDDDGAGASVLAMPVSGPGAGKSRIAFVRVGASPREWRQRLLLNLAVLGAVDGSASEATLRAIATAPCPPVVEDCGELPRDDDGADA